jgi:putative tryptophan/tyrosine transport system substrate-binding protein
MRRREFIALLGGASMAWPLTARAQQPMMKRIAILMHGVQTDSFWQKRFAAFHDGLAALGWVENRNVHIEVRYSANDYGRLTQLAREVISLNPDVIFTNTTPAVKALQQETARIPLIFVEVSDPIGAGVVANLARPGGNITGFLYYENTILGKWVGMLKEIAPQLTRVALIGNPKGFPYGYYLRTANSLAPSFGVEVVPVPIANAGEIEQSVESFARAPNGGLLAPNDNTVSANRDLVIALAARLRLPSVYAYRDFVTSGGLMCYSTDLVAQFGLAATYVDRILRGTSPADLPVEAPTKYETVLNLKTAKAAGFDVPPTLLVRADEVIE